MTSRELTALVELACLLEASAPKPGNVSPGRHFADARFEDFVASAIAVGPVIGCAAARPLGATVRLAIEATARWTRSNTNLGVVLLLTPIARAATAGGPLRRGVRTELEATTVADAQEVYRAIRLASPGGLGDAPDQDVANEPTVTLIDAMRLAADRDAIAREYATGFATTFDIGLPALLAARVDGLDWDDAVVETFLRLLIAAPDTHIARRSGTEAAAEVAAWAQRVVTAGGVRTSGGRQTLQEMDGALRDVRDSLNPGATADLTAAAILVALLGGAWTGTNGDHA